MRGHPASFARQKYMKIINISTVDCWENYLNFLKNGPGLPFQINESIALPQKENPFTYSICKEDKWGGLWYRANKICHQFKLVYSAHQNQITPSHRSTPHQLL